MNVDLTMHGRRGAAEQKQIASRRRCPDASRVSRASFGFQP